MKPKQERLTMNHLANTENSRTRLARITGASSGIGQAFALRLGTDGYNLIVVGFRRARLEELVAEIPNVSVRPLVADLGTDAGVEAVAYVCARGG
jgi:NADP-dependent 3-hydroxy acid dehydrogenase YdfG